VGFPLPVLPTTCAVHSIQHAGGDRVSYVQQWIHKKAPRSGEVG
jgi:hypothetical protein